MLIVKRYSRDDFKKMAEAVGITDITVDNFPEYFICINSTGWIHKIPYFNQEHNNVINLYFDDIYETGLKVIPWFNNDKRIIYAKACNKEQAILLKNFIKRIPDGSTIHVYCAKGKSRSKGVEMYIQEMYNQIPASGSINSNVYDLLKEVHEF